MANLSDYFPQINVAVDAKSSLLGKMLSWWSMNEASGNSRVDSHGINDLAENGVGIPNATGKLGNAIHFAGSGASNLVLTSSASNLISNGSFTLSGWVNFDSVATGANQYVVSRADNGANATNEIDFGLWFNDSTDKLTARMVSGSTAYDAEFNQVISIATWYHVKLFYDSINNLVGIKLNNSAATTTSTSGRLNTGGDQFKFGRLSFSAGWQAYFDGLCDEWSYYSNVTTDEEDAWLYNGGAGRVYSDFT